MDLKWFESKVGSRYLNEAAGAAAEEVRSSREKRRPQALAGVRVLLASAGGRRCPVRTPWGVGSLHASAGGPNAPRPRSLGGRRPSCFHWGTLTPLSALPGGVGPFRASTSAGGC